MQALASRPSACRAASSAQRRGTNGQPGGPVGAPAAAGRPSRTSVAPAAFGVDTASIEATSSLISGVVTTGCLAAAVYMLSQPAQQEAMDDQEACPRCGGSGYEPCHCTRWSDDDLGCASCAGKLGYMGCQACGGGGRARVAYRPIKMQAGPARGSNL